MADNRITNKLLKLKNEIEDLKLNKERLKGKKESYLEVLKNEFSCLTVKDAEKIEKEKLKILAILEEEINLQYEEIENEYT